MSESELGEACNPARKVTQCGGVGRQGEVRRTSARSKNGSRDGRLITYTGDKMKEAVILRIMRAEKES